MTHVLERRGSSKDVWKVLGHDREVTDVYFVFSERVSVFDAGPLPQTFPGLGQLRCAISGRIFQALNNAGFNTHYLSHDIESARMYVKPVNIPAMAPPINYGDAAVGTMVPVELLCRRMITKKFLGRIKPFKGLLQGEVNQSRIEKLLSGELREMAVMDPMFVECSTKYEAADVYLTDNEAAKLVEQNVEWLTDVCYPFVRKLFKFFYTFLRSTGRLLLIDGKIEIALLWDGTPMLVDSASPDELGLMDSEGLLADKNILRFYIMEHYPEWYAKLEEAKELYPTDKSKWPGYPPDLFLPRELINAYVEKTRQVAQAIGALKL